VLLGMGIADAFGALDAGATLAFTLLWALDFVLISVIFAWKWRRHFERGPLEALMRKIAG
jgi:uncharacterized membrane protein YeiB